MQHDAWFFIGIFAFIFLIWIATGGPAHPLAFTGPGLSQPDELGGGTYLSLPRAPFTVGSAEVSLPGSTEGGGTVDREALPKLTGGSYGTSSVYRGLVSMSHSISGAGSLDPSNETVRIQVSSNAGLPVDITGWTLMSEASGARAVIPKGTKVPTSGVVNEIQDIILMPGERAIISSGRSPIGASFQENKCIGYFSTYQKFSPSLPSNCPTPPDELSRFYGAGYIRDAACLDYVNGLNRCQVAITPPSSASGGCQSFIVKYLNYNGCVDAHKEDSDFSGVEWRIFLGRTSSIFRNKYEIVKLLDAKGNTVDAFSY